MTKQCPQINPQDYRSDVDRISREFGYRREDVIDVGPGVLHNFQDMYAKFRREHQHPDEEVRFVLKGSGFFDVRTRQDTWVRLQVTPGDFLRLPSGIFHRFSLPLKQQDTQETPAGITLLRLFLDDEPYRIQFREPGSPAQQAVC